MWAERVCRGGARVLIEHGEGREGDLEDKFIALWRNLWRGGGGSDRLDYESTHRRTLFNVSLTFLVSISSPLTRSCCRDGQEGEGERWERGSGGRRRRSCCTPTKVTSPRQSQGSGFTAGPANQDGRGSGSTRRWVLFIRLPG